MIKAKYYTTTVILFYSTLITVLSWVFLYDNAFVLGSIFGASCWWLNEYYRISKKPLDKGEE